MNARSSASKIYADMPPAARGLTIGLLGGSFNPAHDGHRHISVEAMRRVGLDRVWWLITPGNPLKDNDTLPPSAERARAAARVANHPRIDITRVEENIGSPFTADTIKHLLSQSRGMQFVWLMGGDNLIQFHEWARWRDIAAMVPIAVMDRPGARHKALASPAARFLAPHQVPPNDAALLTQANLPIWTYLDIPLSNQSSSALRQKSQTT